MRIIIIIGLLAFLASCKTTKHVDRQKVKMDSVATVNHTSLAINTVDSAVTAIIDTSSLEATIETYSYDTSTKTPFLAKKVTVTLKNGKGKASKKVEKKDSVTTKKKDNVSVQSKADIIHRNVERKVISWWYSLLLIPIGLIIAFVIKYWNKIKTIGAVVKWL